MIAAPPTTRTVSPETVTPIKPSEAIRLGCLLAPVQAFGAFEDGPGTACVLGAMNLGLGRAINDSNLYPPPSFEVIYRQPCAANPRHVGLASPAHLNDHHHWTRERIADWLEGLGY